MVVTRSASRLSEVSKTEISAPNGTRTSNSGTNTPATDSQQSNRRGDRLNTDDGDNMVVDALDNCRPAAGISTPKSKDTVGKATKPARTAKAHNKAATTVARKTGAKNRAKQAAVANTRKTKQLTRAASKGSNEDIPMQLDDTTDPADASGVNDHAAAPSGPLTDLTNQSQIAEAPNDLTPEWDCCLPPKYRHKDLRRELYQTLRKEYQWPLSNEAPLTENQLPSFDEDELPLVFSMPDCVQTAPAATESAAEIVVAA